MTRVAVGQRVTVVGGERRDALDQRWAVFAAGVGGVLYPVPNQTPAIDAWWALLRPDALWLTGGDDLGEHPERDHTDARLFRRALDAGVPVIGVCRGFQQLIVWTGGELEPVEGHVGRHRIRGPGVDREVGSFHRWGVRRLTPEWQVLWTDADGRPEGIRHRSRRIGGLLHHPEREAPFTNEDLGFFRHSLLGGR